MITNQVEILCAINEWLQINYKVHMELIIDCKSITNSIGVDNWFQIDYKFNWNS